MPVKQQLPKVQMTGILRQSLESEGFDADYLAHYFAMWKSLGDAGEYSDPYFGKDGYYVKPLRNGKKVLRHVHLPPESVPKEIADWDAKAKRRSRKTSDTSLIYAHDPHNGYLLMYIAREPSGHVLADMATTESHDLMNSFADAAEAFIHSGSILI